MVVGDVEDVIASLRAKLAEGMKEAAYRMTDKRDEQMLRAERAEARAEQAERQLEQAREALIEDATYIAVVRANRHGTPTGDGCPRCKSDQRELDRIGAVLASLPREEETA